MSIWQSFWVGVICAYLIPWFLFAAVTGITLAVRKRRVRRAVEQLLRPEDLSVPRSTW